MAPRERKRNAAAQRNEELLQSRRNLKEPDVTSNGSSRVLSKLSSFVSLIRDLLLSLLTPDRFWILFFLPSFLRYMHLLRTSLRPHPLTIGSVIDYGLGLSSIIDVDAKIEVVAEGLEGSLETPLWRFDPSLDRGYLIFSQVEFNRLWRWEEGGGAFTIGRSLFLEHAGCHDRVLLELGKKTKCSEMNLSGVRDMSLGLSKDGGLKPIYLCEGGHQRITRLESNGTRVPIIPHVSHNDDDKTACSLSLHKKKGMYYTSLTDQGNTDIMYLPSLNEPYPSPVVVMSSLTGPVHIALSPDGLLLYASERRAGVTSWVVQPLGDIPSRQPFTFSTSNQGDPGGMVIDSDRNMYATLGETGVLVFDSKGTHLGTVSTGGLVATDVALGDDGVLYITTVGSVLRIRTKSLIVTDE